MTEASRSRPSPRAAFENFLRTASLKKTRTRELIFREIFGHSPLHLNAAEIHARLRSKGHRISLATVYRTLRLMVRSGMVSALDLGEDHSHYEPEIDRPGHGHFICLACGRVREFEHSELHGLLTRLGEAEEFQLRKYSLQVFGTCRQCPGRRKE